MDVVGCVKIFFVRGDRMPIYEYGCITCEINTEVTRGFHDEEVIPPCPNCGYKMQRVYNSFGIHFNGSGFYSTDKRG